MYAPNGNSIYPQQLQQHKQPQQFTNNPPPGYQMNQMQPMPVVVQQPSAIIMQRTVVGPDPTTMACPSCQARITTTVVHEASNKTHITALVLCLVGCWFCCLFPYCIDSCQSANHTCPRCNAFLGSYRN